MSEPTKEMIEAGAEAFKELRIKKWLPPVDVARHVYQAMQAAAPSSGALDLYKIRNDLTEFMGQSFYAFYNRERVLEYEEAKDGWRRLYLGKGRFLGQTDQNPALFKANVDASVAVLLRYIESLPTPPEGK